MSEKNSLKDMPEAYKTDTGRIIRANMEVHKEVCRGQLNYTACKLPKAKPVIDEPGVIEKATKEAEEARKVAKDQAEVIEKLQADLAKAKGSK